MNRQDLVIQEFVVKAVTGDVNEERNKTQKKIKRKRNRNVTKQRGNGDNMGGRETGARKKKIIKRVGKTARKQRWE